MDCRGKQVMLTGASGGIGQAVAFELHQAGACLTLVGRDRQKLAALAEQLDGAPATLAADLQNAEDIARLRQHAEGDGLDLLVNAVGVMDFGLFDQQSPQALRRMVETNLLGPMLLCQQLLPHLLSRGEAGIVNIGSIFGSIGHPGFTAYCASKFGLRGFTEALQRELHDRSVFVAYLAPRATHTSMNTESITALNRALGNQTDSPERVATELMKLLGGKRRQRYLGWPERLFVRLNGLFPSLVHSALAQKLHIIRHHAGPDA